MKEEVIITIYIIMLTICVFFVSLRLFVRQWVQWGKNTGPLHVFSDAVLVFGVITGAVVTGLYIWTQKKKIQWRGYPFNVPSLGVPLQDAAPILKVVFLSTQTVFHTVSEETSGLKYYPQ